MYEEDPPKVAGVCMSDTTTDDWYNEMKRNVCQEPRDHRMWKVIDDNWFFFNLDPKLQDVLEDGRSLEARGAERTPRYSANRVP